MGQQIEELRQKIILEIEEMRSRITLINTCIVFYKQIIKIYKETPEKFNLAKNFFNSVTQAYDYTIFCELFKLYEEKAETGSLYYIIARCSKNKNLFEPIQTTILHNGENINIIPFIVDDYIKSIEEELISKQCDIKVIKEYRHKRIAHNDKKYFNDITRLIEQYPFSFDLFEKLIVFANETISTIYSGLTKSGFTYTPTLSSGYDLHNLIKNLNSDAAKME